MAYNIGSLSDFSTVSGNYRRTSSTSNRLKQMSSSTVSSLLNQASTDQVSISSDNRPKAPSAEEKLERMTSDLGLTTEQQAAVKAILAQGLSPDEELTQIKALLTSDQVTTLETKLSQMPQMGEKTKGAKQAPSVEERVERMTNDLSLTTDQAAQLTTIFESYDTKMQEAQTQSARKELMTAMNQEIKAILTSDQATTFEAKIQEMEAKKKGGSSVAASDTSTASSTTDAGSVSALNTIKNARRSFGRKTS